MALPFFGVDIYVLGKQIYLWKHFLICILSAQQMLYAPQKNQNSYFGGIKFIKNAIRDGGSTALYTVYTPYTVLTEDLNWA